ncbi:MAG: hypothetical protein FJ119_08090 [Deltaproteobacteria bacterium]|nr:hypothetical protein [Deltaproteobacteria bacterium]
MVVLLFVFWLRLYLNLWITRTSLTACFLLMWHGPVRFVYYYPALTDPWLIVFLLAGLIGISKTQKNPTLTNICLIGLIVLIGIVFREVVLIIPICFLFATNPIPLSFKKIALKSPAPSFFAGIAILILCYMVFYSILQTIPSTSPTFSFIKTTLYNIKTQSLPTYVLACFITYGPVVVFLIYNWRCSLGFLMKNQFMFVYIVMIAVLAWIGGSDIERFLLWGFPVVYLLIGKSVEENPVLLSPAPFAVFLIAQGLAMRIFWIIPDYPNDFPSSFPILTVPSSACQYFDLYSSYRSIPMIIFAQYLVLMVVLLIWFKSIDKKTKA